MTRTHPDVTRAPSGKRNQHHTPMTANGIERNLKIFDDGMVRRIVHPHVSRKSNMP
jgi:hypothetical protein